MSTIGSSRKVVKALMAAEVSPRPSASIALTPAVRPMAAARCCISARRCSRFVATCMAIAIAKAAIAGTVITTRNLRSIGRSANQRNNSPPRTELVWITTLP